MKKLETEKATVSRAKNKKKIKKHLQTEVNICKPAMHLVKSGYNLKGRTEKDADTGYSSKERCQIRSSRQKADLPVPRGPS